MPGWAHLEEAQRWQLVYYLKSLSPVFETESPEVVPLGVDPGRKGADLVRGHELYEQLGCAACHGVLGRADGASAGVQEDDWGRAIRPINLTQGWDFRAGSSPKDIVTRVMTGMNGSPMPSYAEAVSPEDAWHLAYYLDSLQEEPHWSMFLQAGHVEGRVPDMPDDPRWGSAQHVTLRLWNAVNEIGHVDRPRSVTMVDLKALSDGERLSVRFSWDDASEDRGAPGDALAFALRPRGTEGDIVTLQTWPTPDAQPLDLCVWKARHLLGANRPSAPNEGHVGMPTPGSDWQAREAIVDRFAPLLQGADFGVQLASHAVYDAGRWTLVLTRPLNQVSLEGAAAITPGRLVPIAVAVWDGGNPGARAVSPWVDLVIEPLESHADVSRGGSVQVAWSFSGLVLVVGLVLAVRKPTD